MWFLAARTHHKLLDRVVNDAIFLTGGVFECDIVHRRVVAVLYMLYKIKRNLMHPLYGALPVVMQKNTLFFVSFFFVKKNIFLFLFFHFFLN